MWIGTGMPQGDEGRPVVEPGSVTFIYHSCSLSNSQHHAAGFRYGISILQRYPELVTYGADRKVQAVAYHLLPAMLLNEMQKQVRERQQKDARIAALQQQLVAQ